MGRISEVFSVLRETGRRAFIPYTMAGEPSLEETPEILRLLQDSGADLIELGVPFTDPLADGPVIQAASERALRRGVTLRKILRMLRKARRTIEVPIVLMTYYNPVFKYGVERFVEDAKEARVEGVIIPDLPPDEAEGFIDVSRRFHLDTIFLLAPTSTEDRIALVAERSTGFIYYVSITGITGARLKGLRHTERMIKRIKGYTDKPVAVGFGVKRPQEARDVSRIADGVIVGSEIVRRLYEGDSGLKEYLISLRKAIDGMV